jgi:hypothetical protein
MHLIKYFLVILTCIISLPTKSASSTTYNSIGQVGLINLPSAELKEEQSIYFTIKKNDFTKLGTLTVTPFKWLEASYFYYRPHDIIWGGKVGSDLDKGFNMKLSYKPDNVFLPRFAIGLDDFAGTGRFTKEYVVATYDFNHFKLTTGLGWGAFVGDIHKFKNPLSVISNTFINRTDESTIRYTKGGSLTYDRWFRGETIIFGGIEAPLGKNDKFTLKIESNPFDHFKFGKGVFSEKSYRLRRSESDYNIGLSYKFNKYGNVDFSYIKGNTFNISLSFGFSSNTPLRKKNTFSPKVSNTNYQLNKKNEFYLDLLENLNRNDLLLQTAHLDEDYLDLKIDSPKFINPIQYTSRAAFIASQVLHFNGIEVDKIAVGNITRGIQTNKIEYKLKDIRNEKTYKVDIKRKTKVINPDPKSYKEDDFRPLIEFPVIFNSIMPEVEAHVGSPERFLYWGVGVKLFSEIQFNRNLTFSSTLANKFANTFNDKDSNPDSKMERVRSEVLDYLQQSDGVYIKDMQFDYINSYRKNTYLRIGAGYLERMYAGVSSEFLYKPFNNNFAISLEYNKVKKRRYDGGLKFLEYKVTTKHINTAYYVPSQNILLKMSYGNYLAGDKGYTLDISRRMPSGWQAGFFFTRTNVSAELFGEGSFDKGFYINVPFNIFQKRYSKDSVNFGLKTLTRDGGQKLQIQNKLIDSFYGSSKNEIDENWINYLD